VAFTSTFLAPSWRSFVAAPTIVKQASATVSTNYGIVSVCDKINGIGSSYTLLHYRDTTEENLKQRMSLSELKPESFWHIKGMVFNDVGELVCRGFSFTPVRIVNEGELVKTLDSAPSKTLIREWKEGTVIRVWTDTKGIVHSSTTRRIDGQRSKHGDAPEVIELIHHAGLDMSRFKAKSEADTEEEAKANKIPAGTVFVLLLVNPRNQVQNPELILPTAYLLDTWVRSNSPTQGQGGGRVKKNDTLFGLKRLPYDAVQLVDGKDGVERMPMLNIDQAIALYRQGKSLYVQKGEFGVVYRSQLLGTRYAVRGEREYLYHRFVELGNDCMRLLDCVPPASKELAASYPNKYAEDMEAFLAYMEGLSQPDAIQPNKDTSLYAFHVSKLGSGPTLRDRLIQRLLLTHPLVLYNMMSQVRNKNKSRIRLESSLTSESPSSPGPEDTNRADSPNSVISN